MFWLGCGCVEWSVGVGARCSLGLEALWAALTVVFGGLGRRVPEYYFASEGRKKDDIEA